MSSICRVLILARNDSSGRYSAGMLRCSDHSQKPWNIAGDQWSKARHSGWVVKVPLVLGDPDKVTDCRIGDPDATQRSFCEFDRDTRYEKRSDVGARSDRLKRRQAGWIEARRGSRVVAAVATVAPQIARLRVDRFGFRGRTAGAACSAASRFIRDQRDIMFSDPVICGFLYSPRCQASAVHLGPVAAC